MLNCEEMNNSTAGYSSYFFNYVFTKFSCDPEHSVPYYIVDILTGIGLILALLIAACAIYHAFFKLKPLNKFLEGLNNREDFTQQFEEFRELIETKPASKPFRHIWKEFYETLIIPETYEKEQVIKNTIRPHDFFHYSDLKWTPKSFSSWPNVFVGIGLLFTFIGLAAALGGATATMQEQGGSVSDMQDGLNLVLSGAKVKFLTSIAGLGISIFLSIWIKLWGMSVRSQLHKFCDNLEYRMLFAFSESIEQKQLKQLEEQTPILKSFTDTFAMDLSDELEKRLDRVMQASFLPISTAIREQLDKSDQRGTQQIENMVAQLGEKISAGTDTQMQQIVNSLNSVHETLNATADNFSNAFKSGGEDLLIQMNAATSTFASEIRSLGEQMNAQTQEQLSGTLGEIDKVGRTMSDATNNISEKLAKSGENIVEQLAEAGKAFSGEIVDTVGNMSRSVSQFEICVSTMDEKLRAHANLLDERIDNVANTMPKISDAIRSLTSASEPIRGSIDKLSEMMGHIDTVSSRFDDTRKVLVETSEKILEAQETTAKAWDDYKDRFADIDESLAKVFEQYVLQLNNAQENINAFIEETDSNFTIAGNSLQQAISELADILEELPEKTQAA